MQSIPFQTPTTTSILPSLILPPVESLVDSVSCLLWLRRWHSRCRGGHRLGYSGENHTSLQGPGQTVAPIFPASSREMQRGLWENAQKTPLWWLDIGLAGNLPCDISATFPFQRSRRLIELVGNGFLKKLRPAWYLSNHQSMSGILNPIIRLTQSHPFPLMLHLTITQRSEPHQVSQYLSKHSVVFPMLSRYLDQCFSYFEV